MEENKPDTELAPVLVPYSSIPDTLIHQNHVLHYLMFMVKDLLDRAEHHDEAKMEPGEVEYFDKVGMLKRSTTYNSEAYADQLKILDPALKHHYGKYRHHPEHFKHGVRDMTLVDLLELICDWKASSTEHQDGNILLSIDDNQSRFNYGPEISAILRNTVNMLEEL